MEDFSTPQSSNKIVHTITGNSKNQSFKSENEITKSRNATPTYESANLFYYFSATADNQETQTLATSENSFTFTLQNATWTIFCEIYYGTNLTESNYSSGSKLFVGNTTLTLTDESPTSEDITIQTLPYTESDSKGSANLLIYTETTSVKSATAFWENLSIKNATNATGTQVLDLTQQDSSKNYCDTFNFNGNSVQAGVYKVVFKFYSGEVSGDAVSGSLICSTTKIVNVANSLTTDKWTTNGGFIQNGKFSISSSNILISKATAIYVDGDATTNGIGISVSSPLNSFEDAISLVEGFGIDAPICIKSGTTATFSNKITLSQNITLTTYDENGTIYNDESTVLEESKRGTLQREADEYICNGSVKFTCINVNIEDNVSNPTKQLFFSNVDFSNCAISAKLAVLLYSGFTASFSNVSFTGGIGATVSVYGGSATITDCTFTSGGYALYVKNGGIATVKNTIFSQNEIGICIFDTTSATKSTVSFDGVTIKNSTSYGIQTYQNFTLAGTCTFDDTFYLQDEAMINFDSTYADSSNSNSVFIKIDDSRYVRENQVITGSNIETAETNFAMEKEGWSINNEGKLYEINVGTATNQYYYVDPTNGDDATAEGGNYDKAYKTLQAAVDAITTANAATSGKNYTMYLLGDLQIDSSTTFTTTSDTTTYGTLSTPTLCNIENTSSNALTLNITSWATDSSSYATISGESSTRGRLFKVNGSTSAVKLSVDNVNIKNLNLYDSSSTSDQYCGSVLFMCGANDTASFGSGVVISGCVSHTSVFYPKSGTLTLNCTAKDNRSLQNGCVARLDGTGTLKIIGGTYSSSTRTDGTSECHDLGLYGGFNHASTIISGGTIDSISTTISDIAISGSAYVKAFAFGNASSTFTIGNSYTTTDVSKIIYAEKDTNGNALSLSGGETVLSIADSSSLTVADVIDKFAIYDSISATSPSSIYSLEADSTGKKALLKISTNSSSGSTTTPFDGTVTFSSTASDSLAYGSENKITITATATSGKAITWGNVAITTSGGTEISDATYVSTAKTDGTATTDGTSSTATCVVTFTSSMPVGTYYINVNAEVDGVTYSGSVTATVVKYVAGNVVRSSLCYAEKTFEKSSEVCVISNAVTVTKDTDTVDTINNNLTPYDSYKGEFYNSDVDISPFVLSQYKVTQELFEAVMGTNPSSYTTDVSGETTALRPVDSVSWYDAVVFCSKLSSAYGYDLCYAATDSSGDSVDLVNVAYDDIPSSNADWTVSIDATKNGFRLPSRAEWEFAARGGDPTKADWNYAYSGVDCSKPLFASSDTTESGYSSNEIVTGVVPLSADSNLDNYAWYWTNSNNTTHEVGLKKPNRLGLYDMTGNNYQWANDEINTTQRKSSGGGLEHGLTECLTFL